MPLLTELENLYCDWFYKDGAPTVLKRQSSVPQVVGERAFLRRGGVEDAGELRAFGGEFRELERAPRLEPDEEDALTVLRHHFLRVDHLPMDLIPEGVGQGVVDDLEGAALVMRTRCFTFSSTKAGGWW